MNYKKALALVALVPLLGTSFSAHAAEMMTTTSVNVNTDINYGLSMMDFHVSAANFLASEDVIENHANDTSMYNFTSNITRREMLKVMMNVSGKSVPDSCMGKFNDMDASDWGCKYAEAALANGYIAANATFRPNDTVTEAESLKMIMQAKGIERDANDDWKMGYQSKAMSEGLIAMELNADMAAKRGWIFDVAARSYTSFTAQMMDDQEMSDEEGVMVGGALMVASKDIVDNAVMSADHSTLVAAVQAAGLVDTLKSEGPFTVFAPTNAAFAALPEGTVATLLLEENKDQLVDILTYHVVAGAYTSADITNGLELTTVNGDTLEFTIDAEGMVWINGSAMVTIADVISSNGVTHVIDAVLVPAE